MFSIAHDDPENSQCPDTDVRSQVFESPRLQTVDDLEPLQTPSPTKISFPASSCAVPLLPPYAPSPLSIPSPDDAKAILTLDGGGVRGIFAPLFLRELQKHLPPGVDVRELLDLVGGTSTGGIAAMMFARMGLPLEKVIDTYRAMPKKLFGGRRLKSLWWLFTSSQHSTKKQRKVYSRAVKEVLGDAAAPLKPAAQESNCALQVPVFTVAVDAADLSRPTVFSSYTPTFQDRSKSADSLPTSEVLDDVTIVTAALATSAAPTYFHPTVHAGHSYIDGGVGFNNPAELALKQLTTLYGPTAYANTLISIGTGRRNENPYRPGAPRTRSGIAGMIDMLRAFAHISTDAEAVHARLEERFSQTGAYFRFNPVGLEDIVLDDWTAVDDAIKASLTYLELSETQKRIAELAERLLRARSLAPE
ncbi:FabD/lysophospholipase-like protein [Fomitiporia mediterranea MF3/22]|uniref:FabD/lysophospholipase-like protein n=1 Tax=Fomitiporia mediterranea (strain MF3/22) TaxID=694068 RepID=UPI00044078C8|nr:FabD/lysophospholipase-like protein [Fomitiporia mediterranea MF3/22]EJD00751.1 FabD/lysophospholipase-like protein [Fomitiporia mediterranea MF3/22]